MNKLNALGIDLGGTAIKFGIVNQSGEILYENIIPTRIEKNGESILNRIRFAVQESILFSHTHHLGLEGIGIGIPGIVDRGFVMGSENIPELNGTNPGEILEKEFGLPVYLENDANVMALAELEFGKDKSLKDLLFLTVGTGIGGAMVIDRKLYGGYRNRGTEFGHLSVNLNGPTCNCGSKGCLEILASVPALIKDYRGRKGNPQEEFFLDGKFMVSRYLEGEKEALESFESHFQYLSHGLASLINILSPQKIIIGGGISESGDFYISQIRKRTLAISMKETSEFVQIERAEWGNKAGFIGASTLILGQHGQK